MNAASCYTTNSLIGTMVTYIESSWSSHGETSRHARPGPHVSHRLHLRIKTLRITCCAVIVRHFGEFYNINILPMSTKESYCIPKASRMVRSTDHETNEDMYLSCDNLSYNSRFKQDKQQYLQKIHKTFNLISNIRTLLNH